MSDPAAPTTAQVALLEWVARIGAVTDEALAVWRGVGLANAGEQLACAKRAGLLTRQRVLVDEPALYTPTNAGMRAASQPGLRPFRVTAANAVHLLACASVAAVLEHRYPGQRVQGEYQLCRDERNAGRPLASASLRAAGGGVSAHRPDLVLWSRFGAGHAPVAVEVELSIKSFRRLRAICTAWAECRCVAGVVYIATPDVEAALRRAIAAAAATRQIAVVVREEISGLALQRSVPSAP